MKTKLTKKIRRKVVSLLLVAVVVFADIQNYTFVEALEKDVEQSISHEGRFDVIFNVKEKWNGHFNGEVIIKNVSNEVIHNWNLYFTSQFRIENIWNAKIIYADDDFYFIENADWNADIVSGASVSFGFTASIDANITAPENYKMLSCFSDVKTENYSVEYVVNTDWGTGYRADIIITNKSEDTIEDWQLKFYSEREIEYFWSADIIDKSKGYYTICHKSYNADIKAGESITIGIMGGSGSEDFRIENCILQQVNYKEFGDADSDNDSLTNELELELGSDYNNADTDGDGLDDGYEYSVLETDLCRKDTDEDGITDGEEDFDEDGLNNSYEYSAETEPMEADTDEDGLNDYQELIEYKTDAFIEDTDEDELSDGDDVKLGFSPLKKDTNENGILDKDEIINQVCTKQIDNEERKGVDSVSVSLSVSGNIDKQVRIDDLYNVDLKSSEVVGLIGVPVEITSNASFDKAKITFCYNEAEIGEADESNLAILWHDEENDWYELLENTVVNTITNEVSVETTHFSKYLLVDTSAWNNGWAEEMDYRGDAGNYDIVYTMDVSKSMNVDNKFNIAKSAIHKFLCEQTSKDKGAIVSYGKTSSVVCELGTAKSVLIRDLTFLAISEEKGNDIEGGLKKSIEEVLKGSNKNKLIILIGDGKVTYDKDMADEAKDNGIKIYTVNVGSADNDEVLKKYAEITGGEYFFCPTSDKIETVLGRVQDKTISAVDTTDSDGDGVFDVYEKVGIKLSNGKKIKTDPDKKDTDGDGMEDGEEIGAAYVKKKVNNAYDAKYGKSIRYFKLYSNPKKKDTDNDGVKDPSDAYPWHGYCGGKHATKYWSHDCKKNQEGYFVCRKKECGYQFKSPEMQDSTILSLKDKQIMIGLKQLRDLYAADIVYTQGKNEEAIVNVKLINNAMRKIRRKACYRDKYDLSNKNGRCISKRYAVKGRVVMKNNKLGKLNAAIYSGLVGDAISIVLEANCPRYGLLWDAIVQGTRWERYSTMDKANIINVEVTELIRNYILENIIEDRVTEKVPCMKDYFFIDSIFDLVKTINSNQIQSDDNLVEIDLIRGNKFPSTYSQLDSINSEFVFHNLNQPSYLEIAEYGL